MVDDACSCFKTGLNSKEPMWVEKTPTVLSGRSYKADYQDTGQYPLQLNEPIHSVNQTLAVRHLEKVLMRG